MEKSETLKSDITEGPFHEDIIYRRFFKAGIITALSAGALWGAFLLVSIAVKRSFTSISIHDINAHGHAQVMGWVGLFIMGFAYQAFPRFKQGIDVRTLGGLWAPFILVNVGCTLRVSSQILTDFTPFGFRAIGFSGFMEVTGIALWASHIWRTMKAPKISSSY
ncbi:MAG: hypothetical protein HY730_05075 [Candidatus Tectomicrobia bacterium]|uniref:Cbb3-type cytochrome c oxidase subunit I n=1 Tax=Tectimicrobiota bacterium TaxID=2528274 RepID=A0A933GM97_UNCTE|nr:hypothetical protein [Candidatus Tectomicrobia bacterium]